MSPLALVIAFLLLAAAGAAIYVGRGERASGHGPRPWWGNPWTWLLAALPLLFLGLVVAPRLFGGVILLLPFVWIARGRRGGGPRA